MAALTICLGCAPAVPREIEVGVHRVRLTAPRGWEVLEHGQKAWVRRAELAISLSDLGPTAAPDEPIPPPHAIAARVLARSTHAGRREIAHGSRRSLHGREWAELETWDRVSHMNRARVAFLTAGGHVLAVAIESGPIEQTGPAFEQLLQTVEVVSEPASARQR
jgi:hypothetical protein